jgi:phage shock protein A
MNLLDRVATLIRANLNDLIDRAEDPEKMVKQVLIDMHNQLIQVKTQVAIAIGDEHKLERRYLENLDLAGRWQQRAELAVDQGDDGLARSALERRNSYQVIAEGFYQQWEEQKKQVLVFKDALAGLEAKIHEAEMKKDLLIAQNRRAVGGRKVAGIRDLTGGSEALGTFRRLEEKVADLELRNRAERELASESVDERFAKMENSSLIDRQLAELKEKKARV